MSLRTPSLLAPLALALALSASAQATKEEALKYIDDTKARYEDVALKIWSFAEVGFKEQQSSALLQSQLKQAGFTVQAGVAEMPTAFVASYGSGHPIIAILGEFDALPGISQEAVPEKKTREGANAGHACGHHLFGTASAEAAVAVKEWMKATGQAGTIRFYGCPAEEGGSGKVYLVRAGLFNDVDTVLHWHPADRNGVSMSTWLANISAKFRFHGIAAHAAASPEKGRSALDAVEAMDNMVNMMREHVPETTRIHYVITRGGDAPNVVPAFAEVYYYVRSPSRDIVKDVFDRVSKAAQGAALGTGTSVDWEIQGGTHEMLNNETLGEVLQKNMSLAGGVAYTAEEKAFGAKLQTTLTGKLPALETAAIVAPWDPTPVTTGGASSDVGDVSWTVPTMGFGTATWVPGTPAHSWQAVAAGGMTIGLKGMQVAAKTLAGSAIDLFQQPALIDKAKKEFLARRGSDFTYSALLGDRKPALHYRD